MSITAVVFDIGNVLIGWNPERHYDAVIGSDRRRALFDAVDLHDMNSDVDLGADFRARVYQEAERWPDWSDEVRMWHDDWIHMVGPVINRSVRLLRALRAQGVPVFALSNFGVGTFELAQAKWPFLTEFDQHYISGHMQMVKPDTSIYAALEEQSGVVPSGLLFADDLPKNIETAAARGWQAHLFDGPDGWADRLVAEGLLTKEQAL